MGAICSKGSAVDKSPSDTTLGPDRVIRHDHERGAVKEEERKPTVVEEAAAKRTHEQQQPQQQQPPQQHQQPQRLPALETAAAGVSGGAGAAPWDGVPSLARLPSQKSGMGMARAGAAKASALPMFLVFLTFAVNVCAMQLDPLCDASSVRK